MFVTFVFARVMEASTPSGPDKETVEAITAGFAITGFFMAEVVALGLGIGGLFQKEKNRICAILGTAFSFAVAVIKVGRLVTLKR